MAPIPAVMLGKIGMPVSSPACRELVLVRGRIQRGVEGVVGPEASLVRHPTIQETDIVCRHRDVFGAVGLLIDGADQPCSDLGGRSLAHRWCGCSSLLWQRRRRGWRGRTCGGRRRCRRRLDWLLVGGGAKVVGVGALVAVVPDVVVGTTDSVDPRGSDVGESWVAGVGDIVLRALELWELDVAGAVDRGSARSAVKWGQRRGGWQYPKGGHRRTQLCPRQSAIGSCSPTSSRGCDEDSQRRKNQGDRLQCLGPILDGLSLLGEAADGRI